MYQHVERGKRINFACLGNAARIVIAPDNSKGALGAGEAPRWANATSRSCVAPERRVVLDSPHCSPPGEWASK
ncbi:hypothetical protein [Mycolicibacterium brisbanense]